MILKRNTQAALDRARADLAALATAIAELGHRREVALVEADDIEVVHSLDREAHDQGLKLRALHDRIAFLEHKLVDEQAEQAKRDYSAAVAKIEAALPQRQKAAEQVERALAGLASSVKEFCVATEATMQAWPADTPWPVRVFPRHCLSPERLGRLVQETFEPARGHADKRPRQPSEYLTRAANADQHRGFAATEKQLHDEFIADLRTAHDPPAVIEDQTAVENAA